MRRNCGRRDQHDGIDASHQIRQMHRMGHSPQGGSDATPDENASVSRNTPYSYSVPNNTFGSHSGRRMAPSGS